MAWRARAPSTPDTKKYRGSKHQISFNDDVSIEIGPIPKRVSVTSIIPAPKSFLKPKSKRKSENNVDSDSSDSEIIHHSKYSAMKRQYEETIKALNKKNRESNKKYQISAKLKNDTKITMHHETNRLYTT